jgi:hypothetical protein
MVERKDLDGTMLFVRMNDTVAVRGRGVHRNIVHYWDSWQGYDPIVQNVTGVLCQIFSLRAM